ncbi:MAG: transketolase [Bacteroidales bacterium]|nr:transketolase [Bacteroidales bacterium]HOY38657.1 transketolase [Bacteroidales bacterium]HQP03641.1 transketolase [Bacteroidales bacterium]
MDTVSKLQNIATQVRRDVLRMVHSKNSGHPGGALGCADLLTALYFEVLHQKEVFDMAGNNEDMFFLSNGHLSAVWYSVLSRKGYFPVKELSTFRAIDSRLQGHPATAEHIPGVRVASGSLGQGLSVAAGAALGKKMSGDKNIVYCLCGDGELQEGQIWEAAMFATARCIDNLIAIVDYNGKQIDGPVDSVISLGNLKAKWEAFGWIALETNGNDMRLLLNTLNEAKHNTGNAKPVVILMKTIMGMGVDFMMDDHRWHGSAPDNKQLELALQQLPVTLGDY